MSESAIPPYVDTRKVFLQEGKLAGTIDFARLTRFQECLIDKAGNVHIELEFSINKSKQRLIAGKLWATVSVACQRCLEAVQIDLEDTFSLALVRNESEAAKLEGQLDPWICDDHRLDVSTLIEEQLLLCLPIVNNHEDKNCLDRLGYQQKESADFESTETGTGQNPFAILETLKD